MSEQKSDVISRIFSSATGLGAVSTAIISAVVGVGTVAIWGNEYIKKIDTSQIEITQVKTELQELRQNYKDLASAYNELMKAGVGLGAAGQQGPAGPQGPVGAKGPDGAPGMDSKQSTVFDDTIVQSMIQTELKKMNLNVHNQPSLIDNRVSLSNCIVLDQKVAKFWLKIKIDTEFCLTDGEIVARVANIDTFSVTFSAPSQPHFWCNTGSKCSFGWFDGYTYGIESLTTEDDRREAVLIFTKK